MKLNDNLNEERHKKDMHKKTSEALFVQKKMESSTEEINIESLASKIQARGIIIREKGMDYFKSNTQYVKELIKEMHNFTQGMIMAKYFKVLNKINKTNNNIAEKYYRLLGIDQVVEDENTIDFKLNHVKMRKDLGIGLAKENIHTENYLNFKKMQIKKTSELENRITEYSVYKDTKMNEQTQKRNAAGLKLSIVELEALSKYCEKSIYKLDKRINKMNALLDKCKDVDMLSKNIKETNFLIHKKFSFQKDNLELNSYKGYRIIALEKNAFVNDVDEDSKEVSELKMQSYSELSGIYSGLIEVYNQRLEKLSKMIKNEENDSYRQSLKEEYLKCIREIRYKTQNKKVLMHLINEIKESISQDL